MDAPRLEPGTVLAGKYRLGQRLGEGGMGTVYLAEHLVLKAQVAVKVIDREVVEGDVTLTRFMREAQAAASLRSPHVVQIIDYGMEGTRPFMVMELLEGETLAARLERLARLSPQETYRVLSHVARAVSKAHEAGIVHRDLKPDNVFLVHNEGDEIAKVLDFGVAKIEATSMGDHSHTRTGSLLGTPYYMSPEQAQGNKEIDYRSDLWALGVIAFEMLVGQRPFSSDGLGDLVIQICIRDIPVPSSLGPVPLGFDAWFARAVAREPEHRFQSARELSESLRDALGITRDTQASDGAWSMPASLPGGALARASREAGVITEPGGFSTMATRADVPSRPGEVPSRPGDAPRPRLDSETMSDVEVPRGSQWAVVPRGSELPAYRRFVTEPPPPSSGFWGFVGVAFLALALGGGAVFLLREAGVPIPGLPAASRRVETRRSTTSNPAADADEGAGDQDDKKASTKALSPVVGSGGSSGQTSPGSGGSTSGSGGAAAAPGGEPTESEILDAVDAAAAQRLGGDGAPAVDGGVKPGGTGGSLGTPDPGGPKPELPEGLVPPPAPPPPAPAP